MDLSEIVREFAGAAKTDPNLIVGFETGDDAGVYRLSDDLALVQTVDYITPVVDDPYLFGQVAAANALSDVYAMGGRPLTAMNLCNFPARNIELADLRRILEGGHSKIVEAGATLVGGHTVRDDELKYGLSVTGLVDPRRVLTNTGAKPGDALVLTKPIGTGVIITAARRGLVSEALLERVVGWMATLNRVACETMLEFEPHACTDITGFGFAGHALGLARGSGVRLQVRFPDLPRYDESLDLIGRGVATSVTASNLQVVHGALTLSGRFDETESWLLVDPQTSGGLLIALPAERAPRL
ncbi:MAG TPA: selenide, water dikinase SelD, partial [Candidatus Polarisedimenticolia bacterium]|nr:selenide, water dikinase SelD [Candidatus Polarisedimenticolia bacterium]